MKVSNLTTRNISVLGQHPKQGGEPFRATIPAGGILELDDVEYAKVKVNISNLVGKGVLEVTEAAVSKLTNEEIIEKVFKETDVKLSKKMNKAELQSKAAFFGVDLG